VEVVTALAAATAMFAEIVKVMVGGRYRLCPSVVQIVVALAFVMVVGIVILVMVVAKLMCGSGVIRVAAVAKSRRPLTAAKLVAPDVPVKGDGGIRSI